jgi:hypothetical protein
MIICEAVGGTAAYRTRSYKNVKLGIKLHHSEHLSKQKGWDLGMKGSLGTASPKSNPFRQVQSPVYIRKDYN